MLPDKEIKCPYTGFQMTCFDGVVHHKCPKWIHTIGIHPQTGQHMDRYDCADTITPLLIIENTNMTRYVSSAIESFRNEMVKANNPIIDYGKLLDGRSSS